jgi:hypothetical protein
VWGGVDLHPDEDRVPEDSDAGVLKRWQDTFLYAKNVDPANDRINLLVFVNAVPARVNWGFAP